MCIDFLIIGHVVKDIDPRSDAQRWSIGGTAAYAGALGRMLGLRVGLLTATSDDVLCAPELAGLEIRGPRVEHATSFRNHYTGSGRRQQLLHRARAIGLADLPESWQRAPLVLLGPVADEVDPKLASAFPQALVGACVQGWLRETDETSTVRARSAARWSAAREVISAVDVAFVSPEDLLEDEQASTLTLWQRFVDPLLYTRAEHGVDVFHAGQCERVGAFEAASVDPTGAGDIFAAAYLIAAHRGLAVHAAARYATCAASFIVEAEGLTGLPDDKKIAQRLATRR